VRTVPPAEELPESRQLRRARLARRAFLAIVFLVVAAGAAGVFGVRSATRSASGDGQTLTVVYPAVARPGLAVPYGFDLVRPGGFDGPVTVAVSESYLRALDQNATDPEPSSATADGQVVEWEFDPPTGDRLRVRFDVRIEPGVQWSRSGWTAVLEDDEPVVRVHYRTWILP
jgi:hypothetical protein